MIGQDRTVFMQVAFNMLESPCVSVYLQDSTILVLATNCAGTERLMGKVKVQEYGLQYLSVKTKWERKAILPEGTRPGNCWWSYKQS